MNRKHQQQKKCEFAVQYSIELSNGILTGAFNSTTTSSEVFLLIQYKTKRALDSDQER